MLKKFLICVVCSLICVICVYAQETLTITTYYPSPYGVYKRLRIYPATDCASGGACSNKGELCFDDTGNALLVCNGSTWTATGGGGGWSLTGNAGTIAGTNFIGTTDAVDWVIKTNNTERMRVTSDGRMDIGVISPPNKIALQINSGYLGTFTTGIYARSPDYMGIRGDGSIGVYGYGTGSNSSGGQFYGGMIGAIATSLDDTQPLCVGLQASAPTTKAFSNGVYGQGQRGVYGNGTVYDFYAGGSGTNYGPFTGAHETKLIDNFPTSAKSGMIVSVTGKVQVRKIENGEISISSTLPTIKLSDVEKDRNVLGVLVSELSSFDSLHWYKPQKSERFAVVNSLGEGRAWVSNINGEIQTGDYITTSAIPGYGQRQDDDLLHNYTLGKAIEDVDWKKVNETVSFEGKSYKIYLIGVVYMSG